MISQLFSVQTCEEKCHSHLFFCFLYSTLPWSTPSTIPASWHQWSQRIQTKIKTRTTPTYPPELLPCSETYPFSQTWYLNIAALSCPYIPRFRLKGFLQNCHPYIRRFGGKHLHSGVVVPASKQSKTAKLTNI